MTAFSVLNNAQAASALFNLNRTQANLNTVQERINSGLRVGSAKDDASTYSVSLGMKNDVAGFKSIRDTLALGRGTVGVALNATETVAGLLEQMKSKVVQAQSPAVDRAAIQRDIQQYTDQIDTIVNSAQLNGVNLVGDVGSANAGKSMSVLASLDRSSSSSAPTPKFIEVAHVNMTSAALGKSATTQSVSTINVDRNDLMKTAGTEVMNVNLEGLTVADGDTISFTVSDQNDNHYKFTLTASDTAASNNFAKGADATAAAAAIKAALDGGAVLGVKVDADGNVVDGNKSIAWSDTGLEVADIDLGGASGATAAFKIVDGDEAKGFSVTDVGGDIAAVTSSTTFAADPDSILRGFESTTLTASSAFAANDQITLTLYKQDGTKIDVNVDGAVALGDESVLAQELTDGLAAQGYDPADLGIAIVADTTANTVKVKTTGMAGGVAIGGFSITNTDGAATDDDILASMEKAAITNERPFAMTLEAEIEKVEAAIGQIQEYSATFGSISQRLELQSEFMDSLVNSLNEGISTLIDANMAEESARFQALQVQQQLGLQALSIANQAPQSVLSLFR